MRIPLGEPDATSVARRSGWVAVLLLGLALHAAPVAAADDERTVAALRIGHGRESNSVLRYRAFAIQAERERLETAALAFRAAEVAESVHAAMHATALERAGAAPRWNREPIVVRSTAENLEAACLNEMIEARAVYTRLVDEIRGECQYDAMASLLYARGAEETHAALFRLVLGTLPRETGEPRLAAWSTLAGDPDLPVSLQLCQGDGSIWIGSEARRCPRCGSAPSTMRVFRPSAARPVGEELAIVP